MLKRLTLFLLLVLVALGYEPLIQNFAGRKTTSLNGEWNYIVDPYENGFYNYRYTPFDEYADPSKSGGFFTNQKPVNPWDRVEYDFDLSETLEVPGDWNSQQENLFYYEGTIWYKKSFDYIREDAKNRVFVHFGAANYQADVYLNGHKLGMHKGGFTPFNYEITHLLKTQDNFLIVKVDNKRKKDEVPTVNTDWWNFGGLTRDVHVVEVPETFVKDYFVQLAKDSQRTIAGYIQLDGVAETNRKVELLIPELKLRKKLRTDDQGRADLSISSKRITYWSPENPKLYDVIIKSGDEEIHDQIGFRTIQTKGSDILLNGESIFLKGISLHEENPLRGGRAHSVEDARLLLGWAKELGCNYVRLAHYPHSENMIRLADEMGMLVWEENPVYWTISWKNEQTYVTAQQQLSEVISRDKNRASVIIWSMANETPVSDARMDFLKRLRDFTVQQDNTRLISAALEMHGEGEGGLTRKI